MSQCPEKATLLDALAEFLLTEVRPYVRTEDASFDVLVAANHASILAHELREEDAASRAQLHRLRRILPDVDIVVDEAKGMNGRRDALRLLNAVLVDRLRTGGFPTDVQRAEAWSHVTSGLRVTFGEASGLPN
ncbi:MAG: DUF6285 domain-containing protein [Myxococcota bacterium]|nr:DUF6285 domain-containing protein [Myxococcota bacterium]